MSITTIIPILSGLFIGILVNYLSDVLPATRKFSVPACGQCSAFFTWTDYFLFRPCPNGHKRSARTWIVLAAAILICLALFASTQSRLPFWPGLVLIAYFGTVFVIDMEHRLILHPTSLFGAVLGASVGIWINGWKATVLGGLAGFLIMLVFYLFGVLVAKVRARRMRAEGLETDDEEALGAGDVILAAILGLMLGWPLIWFGLLQGILLGGVFSLFIVIWLLLSGRYGKNVLNVFIPYGPYFITSAYLILFFPEFVKMIVPDR